MQAIIQDSEDIEARGIHPSEDQIFLCLWSWFEILNLRFQESFSQN